MEMVKCKYCKEVDVPPEEGMCNECAETHVCEFCCFEGEMHYHRASDSYICEKCILRN